MLLGGKNELVIFKEFLGDQPNNSRHIRKGIHWLSSIKVCVTLQQKQSNLDILGWVRIREYTDRMHKYVSAQRDL